VKRVALSCALLVVAAVVVTQAAASPARRSAGQTVHVAKKPVTPGFFQGKKIGYFDFGPVKLKPGNKLAPIWTVTNGVDGQSNIVDTVPGQAGYSPLWRVSKVTWKDGVTPRLLTSADAVNQAEQAGEVAVERTSTVVNCPVLGFGQKRHPGFSAGRAIRYYDLGPVKVAAGNEVVPLYAPTNGVPGQRNIAADVVAPGQTDYPPLWGIIKVTWKLGAHKTALRSKAAIIAAQKRGLLTVTRTALVVNCPIV
jgi:hypothetical protein